MLDNVIVSATEPGEKLLVKGKVWDGACLQGISDAIVDIWHANASGSYDLDGYNLRGKVKADNQGNYWFETILPGKYLNGRSYRPRHIHLKISAPGFSSITTQLYFSGDTDIPGDAAASISSGSYNATDRIISITKNSESKWEGNFDIHLAGNTTGVTQDSLHIEYGLITSCSPNPIEDVCTIKFSVFNTGLVVLKLLSSNGTANKILLNKSLGAGKYDLKLVPKDLNLEPGIYFVGYYFEDLPVHQQKIVVL